MTARRPSLRPVITPAASGSRREPRTVTAAPPRVLIVDDEPSIRFVLAELARAQGYAVTEAAGAESARAALEAQDFALAFVDVRLPGESGLEFLASVGSAPHAPLVVIMTAQDSMLAPVEAMKAGAYEFLAKPFDAARIDEILAAVRAKARALAHPPEVPERLPVLDPRAQIVGRSAAMLEVFKAIGRVARSDISVLLTGESGTGKELVARAIHFNSARAEAPFITINTAAIPRELLESELFGHERGAFTGATERRQGKFELASGGTLFLDEVGDMAIDLQAKVLRALQEKEIQRVGSSTAIPVHVRIIAATHVDLQRAVTEGRFREDLYYRLSVMPVRLPALRERPGDINVLADFFLARYCQELAGRPVALTPAARTALAGHTWPGNVRELENTLKRALVVSSGGIIDATDLGLGGGPEPVAHTTPLEDIIYQRVKAFLRDCETKYTGNLHATVIAQAERPLLRAALEATGYNQLKASQLLGINRNTLRKRMRELGIGAPPKS